MEAQPGKHIELPAPTPWPMAVALAVALLFAGIITNPWVSAAGGVLLLCAAVGWWYQVLPVEHHETVPVRPLAPAVTQSAASGVDKLHTGEKGRRTPVPAIRPFSAALKGGVVGGIGMAGVALLFGLISQGSIWYPINLLAAAAVPSLASASLEELRRFSGLGLGLGIVIHGLTSFLVGVLYSVMLPMFPRKAFWWAGLTAPILWSGLIASTLEGVNPALNVRIDWRWFVASQLAWGLTGGYVIARAQRIEDRQSLPLAVRAGIETPGIPPIKEED